MADTAALFGALDGVVSVCTSTAHLAGAIGAPTWAMLSAEPYFLWLADRRDSPWYPTATLFRQARLGDWRPVVDEVARRLAGWSARGGTAEDPVWRNPLAPVRASSADGDSAAAARGDRSRPQVPG
jgi:hypothetical protein